MSDTAKTYTGCNHILAPGLHIAVGNPSVLLRCGDKEWLMEWHHYFGPSALNKNNEDPVKHQPGERSMFWCAAQWWKDQGAKVKDEGAKWPVCVWAFPPVVETHFVRQGNANVVVGDGVQVGKKVHTLRYWQGYEQWGPIKAA